MKTGPKPKSIRETWEYMLSVSRKEGDCILFEQGRPIGIGYRSVRADNMTWYAHHLAFFMAGKKLEPGQVRRHTCDKPECIEPNHIIAGSHADNVQDKVSRLRHNHGKTHYRSKLTLDQVNEIRKSPLTYAELGHIYGISRGGIHNIKSGRSWRIS